MLACAVELALGERKRSKTFAADFVEGETLSDSTPASA